MEKNKIIIGTICIVISVVLIVIIAIKKENNKSKSGLNQIVNEVFTIDDINELDGQNESMEYIEEEKTIVDDEANEMEKSVQIPNTK